MTTTATKTTTATDTSAAEVHVLATTTSTSTTLTVRLASSVNSRKRQLMVTATSTSTSRAAALTASSALVSQPLRQPVSRALLVAAIGFASLGFSVSSPCPASRNCPRYSYPHRYMSSVERRVACVYDLSSYRIAFEVFSKSVRKDTHA
ncbi:hypothetical protein AWZ03_002251 [Drosophila navojoa]|uniref:Uncharacterized protein n=1 Tax=Drosophila navojoa TaxID=7232 RepID=A0A484BRK8_DRONA|nr:hypothetical protein AWZ03_002251 [Drosophila navojoa]